MAKPENMGASTPNFFAPIELSPTQVGLLQGLFSSCLAGLERDLQRAERLSDPRAARRDSTIYARLLVGLEQNFLAGPDNDACEVLSRLMRHADEANGYLAAAAEHDALQGLINLLQGKGRNGP